MNPRKTVMIQMLNLAREYIKIGRDRGVCSALLRTREVLGNVGGEWNYLRYWINNMMGRPSYPIYLEDWLVREGFASQSEEPRMFSFSGRDKMIQTRLNWIDWMKEELKR